MIRHVVLWRLKPEVKQAGRPENLARIEANLAAMRGRIPGLQRLELGINEASGPDVADLMLLAEFDGWDSLHGYESHPLHDELRGLIGPLRTERRVIDYEF